MARTTLANMIADLRGLANAGTADYTIAGVTYWTDDQLQQVLDTNRYDVYREELAFVPRYITGGTIQYYDYYSQYDNFESTDGGTVAFIVEDSTGTDVGTASYTPDYRTGRIVFAANTAGTIYYLTGRAYDLNGAAADVWQRKMIQVAASSSGFDWSSDNMSVKRSQQVEQAKMMINYYNGLRWPKTAIITRGDINDAALK